VAAESETGGAMLLSRHVQALTAQFQTCRLLSKGRCTRGEAICCCNKRSLFTAFSRGPSALSIAVPHQGRSFFKTSRWNLASEHPINVIVEETPNQRSLKFMADGHPILGDSVTKTVSFRSIHEASNSALVQALFKVTGVQEVMLANKHVTVTRRSQADWDEGVRDEVEDAFREFLQTGGEVVQPEVLEELTPQACFEEGSIEARIAEILEDRVRPFVQQDGGDVAFDRFDRSDGTLYLMMQGSCSGCSQSHATLQYGVKNLMDHYVPEVKLIVGLTEDEEEDLPRPGR